MNQLNHQLHQMEGFIPHGQARNPTISEADVAWHIEHMLLVIDRIITALSQSTPANYLPRFNMRRWLVLALKKMPRGKARAPKAVLPKDGMAPEALLKHIEITRQNIISLGTMNPHQYFTHPVFGDLRLKQAVAVLEIHTNHHLKIIQDILKTM